MTPSRLAQTLFALRRASPRRSAALRLIGQTFDRAFYLRSNPDVALSGVDPLEHFVDYGWRENRNPVPTFDLCTYVAAHPELAAGKINPYLHHLRSIRHTPQDRAIRSDAVHAAILHEFDGVCYRSCFPDGSAPSDPVGHYISTGWHEGRDPNRWFSTRHYLSRNVDVAAAGVNPFYHYVTQGRSEGRPAAPPAVTAAPDLYQLHTQATQPGPHYETFDAAVRAGRDPRAKVIAYYLPQFHATPENDKFWGEGFTEWRNVTRGMPRFQGHVQPRLPRDLGYYDLSDGATYRRQIEMAAAAGVHAFCFYYYWFNGQRVLDGPVETMLADPTLDFPFTLMWANENWTRTWDGAESEVLLAQDYRAEDDIALVDDWARHFADPRYMRVDGRPLFFLYRPGAIPDGANRIAVWRKLLAHRHGLDPIMVMVQGFGDSDPRHYGLDGAIEFPPHKLAADLKPINQSLDFLDPDFAGHVVDYDAVVSAAAAEPVPDYPLIRCSVPSWDNEARRPGRGYCLHGATPEKFTGWMRQSIDYAAANPFFGETIVAVNAWNEWAEGAYLEPDIYHGGAYLNALSRAVHLKAVPEGCTPARLLLVGHDANRNGAQTLLLHLAEQLTRQMGIEVHIVLTAGGPMLAEYRAIAPVTVLGPDAADAIAGFRQQGFTAAITNTTATGHLVPALKETGLRVVSLVHELPRVIEGFGLGDHARAIATQSDVAIFPAAIVRAAFEGLAGGCRGIAVEQPQGLYKKDITQTAPPRAKARAGLKLARKARLVVGMGYADARKGFDRFVATAIAMCRRDRDLNFVWLGDADQAMRDWHLPEIAAAGMSDRIRLTGHVEDVAPWLAAADLFFMTSREDPFPSVVLEALAMGLPVVGYEGTGGCDGLISRFGALVPAADPAEASAAIRRMLALPPAVARANAEARRTEMETAFRFDDYVAALVRFAIPDAPDISVTLPNYNYARYLPQRLSSIFAQTAPVREVIVLDDASPDDSLNVIRWSSDAANRDVELLAQDENSGSPFVQWRKGAERARGEYLWIAEADDDADPRLLARLAAQLSETGADLAFADSWQIGPEGEDLGQSYRSYLNEIEPGVFDKAFVMEGPEFAARFLSVKNVILNVSGVLFRRSALVAALDRLGPELFGYAVAGDWRLYAEICLAGGKVVYDPAPLNGHRRHPQSVTHALKAGRHLDEIRQMQRHIGQAVVLGPDIRAKQVAHLDAARRHILGDSRLEDAA